MKSDRIQYERIYQLLKSRIECGILPVGARLPGRSTLCREFATSERTIRRVLELLEQDGFLKITQRKRPVVISAFAAPEGRVMQNTKKVDAAQVDDLLQTSILLCYPVYLRGLRLCAGDDWRTPEMLLAGMDPDRPREFWQLSSRLWRFFIARNENELLLRVVDSLGFRGKEPPHGSYEERARYRFHIETLVRTVKDGGEPGRAELNAIFRHYQTIAEQAGEVQFLQTLSPCPMLADADGLGQQLTLVQERHSSICLDLLGQIFIGRYQPGDRLPTHDQLQAYYGVSRDTTVRAVRMLQEWGAVTAVPRRGISVVMDLEVLKKIQITPESIACHVRRYLDSLDFLTLTVEKVAAHAAVHVEPEEAAQLRAAMERKCDQPYGHQMIPCTLLDFMTRHIQYDALRSIYGVLTGNFGICRGIPKLIRPDKNPQNCEIYRQCVEAAGSLGSGDARAFAKTAAEMLEQVRGLAVAKCRRLGYWDAAMRVYDGASLWR